MDRPPLPYSHPLAIDILAPAEPAVDSCGGEADYRLAPRVLVLMLVLALVLGIGAWTLWNMGLALYRSLVLGHGWRGRGVT